MDLTPLIGDSIQPITAERDPFGQFEAVQTLQTASRLLKLPGCIALYGGWGAGKTNVLRTLHDTWPHGPAVWFDPWLYERQEDVVSPLLTHITDVVVKLRGKLPPDMKVAVGEVIRAILSMTAQAGWAAALGQSFFKTLAKQDLAKAGQQALDELKVVHDAVKQARDGFRALVKHACPEPDDRMLICLDDLDRCLPEKVVHLIEAVKLLLCGTDSYPIPNGRDEAVCQAVFVFALDRQIVGEAIRNQYQGSSLYTGENYLEKIFDLSLEAPPVNDVQVKEFVQRQLGEAGQNELNDAFGPGFDAVDGLSLVLAHGYFANPRVVTRVLNRLKLLIGSKARRERLRGGGAARARQFLTWVAGVERFRTFRHFFRRAGPLELKLLDDAIGAVKQVRKAAGYQVADARRAPPQRPLPSELQRFVDTPGFIAFAADVAPKGFSDERAPTQEMSTILAFDELMRRAGL